MKYAFIMGSNAFVVPDNTLSYVDHDQSNRFLRILSIQQETPPDQPRAVLTIDADITDYEGHRLQLTANKPEATSDFDVHETPNRVHVTKPDGTTVLDVHQLDEKVAMGLEHNISAELEVNMPVTAIRVRGNFMTGGIHIEIDNEKLFVDGDSYGNSVQAGEHDLRFSHEGVLI
ncbi:MAG TPA: hypothetical protein VHE59_15850 [Mucilaginibacter sp.]|nr:hypothetical protein [Mucilaginibacter sp.]